MKMSIVIPCYDEASNIPLILNRFQEVITRDDIEVILVDNGSTDNTPDVLKELLPLYPFARSVRVDVNQGYGYGIIQGLNNCDGEFIGWTHADMQTDPADLITALNIIETSGNSKKIFVKGHRKGRSAFDMFFTNGMSIFETIYLGEKLSDINAQPNVFSKEFYETWKNPPKDFSLDLYALYMARKANLDVKRFEVQFPERIHGNSHWNNGTLKAKWKFIKRTLDFSKNLKCGGIS
ncbi:MAG: glycosyltransferase family 2 protein [Butyrivibrio sp.]|nr:glycosyltransferase family 2 protein [Butyrivibrio sp.]